jgi:tetratricopeptide (TPR) repeat protein
MGPSPRVPNEVLRQLITEAGWTLDAVARAVNVRAAGVGLSTHYDRSSVAHWLSGTRPRDRAPALIAEALSRRMGREVTVTELGFGQPRKRPAVAQWSRTNDPITDLTMLARADVDPVGRSALRRLVYEARAFVPPDWQQATQRRRVLSPPEGDQPQLDRASTVAAELMAQVFSSTIRMFGGQHALSALTAYLAEDVVTGLLKVPRHPTCHCFTAAATDLVLLAGYMCFDDEAHGLAQRYYLVGLELAMEAADRARYGIGLRLLSLQAGQLGLHGEALGLAVASLETTKGLASAPTEALLHAQVAVCHAVLGHAETAHYHLGCAQHHLDRATDAPPAPIGACHPAELAYYTAQVRTLLGDHQGAITALRSALRCNPATDHHLRALILATMARHQFDRGDLDQACGSWGQFLELRPGLHSSRIEGMLLDMYRRLYPLRATPIVRDLVIRATQVSPELLTLSG